MQHTRRKTSSALKRQQERAAAVFARRSEAQEAAKVVLRRALRVPDESSADEDARLAAEYDAARGYDRSRKVRSKEAHEHAEGAPVVTWMPAAQRP